MGGSVSGLMGTGLKLANNGGEALSVAADGTFVFAAPIESGASFGVTIVDQPTSPTQTCTVSGGTGTVQAGNVESVLVNCNTNKFAVGGSVRGLLGTVVLQNNGGDDLTVAANGTFAFPTPIADLASYAVTVLTQPGDPKQLCTLAAASGNVAAAAVTSIVLTCELVCDAPEALCTSGAGAKFCANTDTDRTNCGGCGTVCALDETCTEGSCSACTPTVSARRPPLPFVPPDGANPVCFAGPDSFAAAACPVVQCGELTTWALSYSDNRPSFAIVTHAPDGTVVRSADAGDGRYVWRASVNAADQTVRFDGQSNFGATLPWSQVRLPD